MNQIATQKQESPSQKLAGFLEKKADDFKSVMVIEPERFLRMVKNSILRDPKIAEATTQSVFLECMKAAADGLVLDGREATLTRFNGRKQINGKWETVTEVAYIPMVAGIMKRVRNSGEIQAWTVGLVYEKEYENGRFSYIAAPVAELRHEPIIIGERGPVVAAYSAVRLKDGSFHYELMRRDELDAIKNRTKSKKTVDNQTVITGPWATDEEEMFKKTVIRRHSKRLPVSSEVLDVTQRVDALYDSDAGSYVIADEPQQVPRSVAVKRQGSAADRLRRAAASRAPQQEVTDVEDHEEDPPHDEETGEILEGEVLGPEEGEKKPAGKTKASAPNPDDEF